MRLLSLLLFITLLNTGIVKAEGVIGKAIIVDGDTIEINKIKIRLYGIDAPEAGQKCKKKNGGSWPCGNEAIKAIAKLTGYKQVSCKGDVWDDFGRLIAICAVNNIEINRELVSLGLAWNFDRYSLHYKQLENQARQKKLGMFQATTTTPWEYRAKRWEVAEQIAPEGCPIKGNIGRNGKVYHPPWSPWYKRTSISIKKGERWFCSEREAIEAGWRAPRWK